MLTLPAPISIVAYGTTFTLLQSSGGAGGAVANVLIWETVSLGNRFSEVWTMEVSKDKREAPGTKSSVRRPVDRQLAYYKTDKFAILAEHFCTFWPPWVSPWDKRGKCYTDGKRIQCWSNALQHRPTHLSSTVYEL